MGATVLAGRRREEREPVGSRRYRERPIGRFIPLNPRDGAEVAFPGGGLEIVAGPGGF